MESSFDKHAVQLYSNFMKYTISNSFYNLVLLIIENCTILFIIDLMFNDKILGEVLTPFYFLSPHLYLDMLNEQFPNECNKIFSTNETIANSEGFVDDFYTHFNDNEEYHNIIFFGYNMYSTDNSFCIYSSYLIYGIICLIVIATFFFVLLFFLNTRNNQNVLAKAWTYIFTNSINWFIRPFFVNVCIVWLNRPLVLLYKWGNIESAYQTNEIIFMLVSIIWLIYAVVFSYIVWKYINNTFYFEKLPFDYFSTDEAWCWLIIKVIIGLKINYDKLLGLNEMGIMNLIWGAFMFVKAFITFNNREFIVNHVYLKNTSAFLSFFYCFYIILKLLNEFFEHLKEYAVINLAMEAFLIVIVLLSLILIWFNTNSKFIFKSKEGFIVESMQFMYYVSRNWSQKNDKYKTSKSKKELFIDNVIIGHKMKCSMEECIICCEDIYNPDWKTLCLIWYQQFLKNEKDYKDENEGLTLIIKLMYLKMIDESKVHRISYIILKNLKNKNLSFGTLIKITYMYQESWDILNTDLKGLITIKYGEMNTDLLKCIKTFEDIWGFIKSRTEKIELVTDKTNLIGKMYKNILDDLHYLRKNKRIFFDSANLLQIICIVRLVFPRVLDNELTENLDFNFIDFLEIVDHVFADNISFLVKYDFNNKTWRIKKLPKKFIDITGYKISDLLDQSLEKIFPKCLAKTRIKKWEEEIIWANVNDAKLEFKTVISDKDTNVQYVKFLIDIVPHWESSYILFMHCHFHRRHWIIIDELGNFVNGSQVWYEKVGINAEIVQASKGRINMFTMFTIEKKQKLEDVKIVYVSSEGVVDATKNIFLLEKERGNTDKGKQTTMPGFLNTFIQNEATGGFKKKDKSVVFLHLFSKEIINEIQYFIYTIKIDNPEEKKKRQETVNGEKQKGTRSVTIKKYEDYSGSSDEDRVLLTKGTTIHNKNDKRGGEKKSDDKKEDEINTYQNYVNYYNTFYESQHSMSMTMNYKTQLESYNSSQANSTNSDIFNYLYMKAIGDKSNSNKFETFIYIIFIWNTSWVLFGLVTIIYIQTYSTKSLLLLDVLEHYYLVSTRIYKATNVFFSFVYYDDTAPDNTDYYSAFWAREFDIHDINYDQFIKVYWDYDSSKILNDIIDFNGLAFDYWSSENYNKHMNIDSNFIHWDSSGNFNIKVDKIKSIIDWFTWTINQLSNRQDNKILLKIKFLNYEYLDGYETDFTKMRLIISKEDEENPNAEEKIEFTKLINWYQHFFNYFNTFVADWSKMNSYLTELSYSHFDSLHNTGKSLLIFILIINVIFVLICLSSIIIYKKILRKEFQALYGMSEDNINKLKEKFQYVKEWIKWEQAPSQIYERIRKMREEIEQALMEEKMKEKRKEKEQNLMLEKEKTVKKNKKETKSVNGDDNMSVVTTNSANRNSDYLRFSGAVKGLFRSSTLRAKEQLKKLSKESWKWKASQELLNRWNFDFEMIKNFIFFILFMIIFFIVIGIVVIIITDSKYKNVETSLKFTQMFHDKFSNLYNFYIGTKLTIMFNNNSPYTWYLGPDQEPKCTNCMFEYLWNYSSISGELSTIAVNNGQFSFLSNIDSLWQGANICESIYTSEYKSSFLTYVQERNSKNIDNWMEICKKLPILQSNVDSIFTNIVVYTKMWYNVFLTSEQKELTSRIGLLSYSFWESDIIVTMFVNFYYEHVYQNQISSLNKNITKIYYSFMVVIFVINILIDFFMIIFIWFKIYRQIIFSVNNVQLVSESVSVV